VPHINNDINNMFTFAKMFVIINSIASIAQLVEQLTFNQRVLGSSPSGGTFIYREIPSSLK
jgi:hypothetical protein